MMMQLKNWARLSRLGIAFAGSLWGCGDGPPAALVAPATGVSRAPIVNGTRAGPQLFAEVGVLVTTNEVGRLLFACTATRFAPDLVLTAAHCLASPPPGEVWQTWFSTAADAQHLVRSHLSRVTHTFVHPDYGRSAALQAPLAWREGTTPEEVATLTALQTRCGPHLSQLQDVDFWQCVFGLDSAFLRELELVDGPVNAADVGFALLDDADVTAPRAHLPTAATPPVAGGDTHLAVGYGGYNQAGAQKVSMIRHYAPIEVQGVGTYELQVSHAEAQVCSGDSGGPLLAPQADGYAIVGIASRGFVDGAGVCRGPVLYARTRAFTPWIRASARKACREQVRSAQMCRDLPL
jgi:hypothetical protein